MRLKVVWFFVSVLFICLFGTAWSDSRDLEMRQSLGFSSRAIERLSQQSLIDVMVLGDSMAAGALADSRLGQTLSGSQIDRIVALRTLHHHYPRGSPEYLREAKRLSARMEDSAFSSTHSWGLISRLNSHPLLRGRRLRMTNRAVLGATAESLGDQIFEYRQDYRRGLREADLVVVNVGGNDWCREEVTPESYRESVEFRLYQVLSDHPGAVVMVNSLPPMVDLFGIPDQVAFVASGQEVMCSELDDFLAEDCPKGIRFRRSGGASLRAELQRQVTQMKSDLQRVASKMRDGGGSYAPYGGELIFVNLADEPARAEHLAADCFHPGTGGHKYWAQVLWRALTAP